MINEIIKEEIKVLPPLNKTFLDIQNYQNNNKLYLEDLIKIIEKDPMLSLNIIKITNSAFFGFKEKTENISRAINLLGENMVISISLGKLIENSIGSDLKPYSVSNDDFFKSANLSLFILKEWFKGEQTLVNELYYPVFLFQIGKFILSNVMKKDKTIASFKNTLKDNNSIPKTEQELYGVSNSYVSSLLLEHWGIGKNWSNILKYVNDIENAPTIVKTNAKIINVIEILVNIKKPLSEQSIQIAKSKISEYELDGTYFDETIIKAKEILDNF